MRTFPPLQVSVRRFVVWRCAVATFALLATGSVGAWAALGPDPLVLRAVLTGASLFAIGYAARWLLLIPAAPADLRWDGARWLVAGAGADLGRATPVLPEVTFDAGGFMLLRLRPHHDGARGANAWLPIERAALGADWHPLRCALYSTRPEVVADDTDVVPR